MFRTPTVLIVGAGASQELGFPSGATLLTDIAEWLSIEMRYNDVERGNPAMVDIFRQLAQTRGTDGSEYVRAARRIAEAARISRSIDNVLFQNSQYALVDEVAKLAITLRIHMAEANCRLRKPHGSNALPELHDPTRCYLFPFGQALVTDVAPQSLEGIFANLTVINFNYDRSFEAYLPVPLVQAFGMPERDAQLLASKLKIFHPYGKIGSLPSRADSGLAVAFGELAGPQLADASKGVRTFGESIENDAELTAMRSALGRAEQVVFLGFGFHRQNMELLAGGLGIRASRVLGTVFEESTPAVNEHASQIRRISELRQELSRLKMLDLTNLKCTAFLDQYYSPLTS